MAVVAVLAGCGASATSTSSGASTANAASGTAAPENNSAGDIPDTQVFVSFTPPTKLFTVSVPEGWAQTTDGVATVFTDKLNAVRIEMRPALAPLTPDTIRQQELPAIQSSSPGNRFGAISVVQRKSGPVFLVTYQATSPPNEVTGKSGVDAVERYEFWRDGHEAILTLSGPLGADNVDPWRTITDSLQWQ
ncbi:hypothetical protein [Mycobacterium sp. AZCC_0083]|uniref:hypothetical protein n=1 Tax=Mycobacterium sp. AZCC_0083 TaxID=2735882 RepID=UPI0017C060FD|nr:hypothetical protein [Mycobacterium sp. AZCC_0083]MBB5168433.1 hypothetical protein [Mycobacterium sp. AZCC_0083]